MFCALNGEVSVLSNIAQGTFAKCTVRKKYYIYSILIKVKFIENSHKEARHLETSNEVKLLWYQFHLTPTTDII
jgi:hypothetical protein